VVVHRARGFDIDEFSVAWAELAQVSAYRAGIAFLLEEMLPLVIGGPPALAAVIPGSDSRIGSGSKRNAVHMCLMPGNILNYCKRDYLFQTHPSSLNATCAGEADTGGHGVIDRIGVDYVGNEYPEPPTLLQQGSSAARPELWAMSDPIGSVRLGPKNGRMVSNYPTTGSATRIIPS
jgi:hypothetical protein